MNVIQFPTGKPYVKSVLTKENKHMIRNKNETLEEYMNRLPAGPCYVSPFLLKPIRSYEQVCQDIAKREQEDRHNRAQRAIDGLWSQFWGMKEE